MPLLWSVEPAYNPLLPLKLGSTLHTAAQFVSFSFCFLQYLFVNIIFAQTNHYSNWCKHSQCCPFSSVPLKPQKPKPSKPCRFNPPGKSPPFCVEYYTGWLTHWGEPMAKTAAGDITKTLAAILAVAKGTGSVNLYMAAGGTNFGPCAGANVLQG